MKTYTPLGLVELTKPSIVAWFSFAAQAIEQACKQKLIPAPNESALRDSDTVYSRKVVRITDAMLVGVGFQMTIIETDDGIEFEILGTHKRLTAVKWRLVRDTSASGFWLLIPPDSKHSITASPTLIESAADITPHVLTGFRPADELLIARCLSAYRPDFDTARQIAYDRVRDAHEAGDNPTVIRFSEFLDEIEKRQARFERERAAWQADQAATAVIARASKQSGDK